MTQTQFNAHLKAGTFPWELLISGAIKLWESIAKFAAQRQSERGTSTRAERIRELEEDVSRRENQVVTLQRTVEWLIERSS